MGGTGGRPICNIKPSSIQKETLPLMSQASISGHSDSKESVVEFVFDEVATDKFIGKYLMLLFILLVVHI